MAITINTLLPALVPGADTPQPYGTLVAKYIERAQQELDGTLDLATMLDYGMSLADRAGAV